MPPTTKTKASPPKPTGGARAKAARTVVTESPQANTKKKRKKKKIKQKRGAVTEQALPDGTLDEWEEGEDEDDDVETEIVYACPACGLGAGTSVPMGCPYPEPCRGMMFVCRREDGGGRCGSLCWHSHPNELVGDDTRTYSTAYWCRFCCDECDGDGGCETCKGHSTCVQEEQRLWANFGEPVRRGEQTP